jgi:hypothetical protein
VAFCGSDGIGGQEGVYWNVGGALSVVADRHTLLPGTAEYFHGFTTPALDGSNIAFGGGSLGGAQAGYCAHDEGTLLKVIELGDILEGREVAELYMSTEGLDGAQMAFTAIFTDGFSAIYVATLPEPGTLGLLARGALASARRRH